MSYQKESTVYSGTVLQNKKIAAHTFHLQIQSNRVVFLLITNKLSFS